MNVGIIGTGWIAEKMAVTLAGMSENKLLAVGSRSPETARDFAERFGVSRAYGNYTELCADSDLDLVYIATPHSFHRENIIAALNAGRNVLCEKPFTVNAAEAREACALAEKKGLMLAEAMWTRYMPLREKFALVPKLGKPLSLTADLAYPNAHIRRMYDLDLAGGALLDLGVYAINFAIMALGDDISEIRAKCEKFTSGADVSDEIELIYKDGSTAKLTASLSEGRDSYGIIEGSGGRLVFKNINNFEWVEFNGERFDRPEQITGYEYQVRACAEAIRRGLTEPVEFRHAEIIKVMEIMDEIRRQWNLYYPCENISNSA